VAIKAVVNIRARERIRELLRRVTNEKGPFFLATLAQSSPELADRWNFIVSAPWIDALGPRSVVRYLSSNLKQYLDNNALSTIERISPLPGEDPFVKRILHSSQLSLDQPEVHMRNWQVGDWFIPEGYIFVADAHAKSKLTNPSFPIRKTVTQHNSR